MTMKKTSGRRKIEIKLIEKTSSRQITFSKRRTGLFNKASELCLLTGAEIAILVQSPGSRLFSFGHPNVESVIDKYLGNNVSNLFTVSENPSEEYNEKYLKIAKELEVEKKKINNVEESGEFWCEKSFEKELEIDELENYMNSLEKLKTNMTNKADELMKLRSSSSFDTNPNTNNLDGLLDDPVILPDFDGFLPNNVGVNNEDLMLELQQGVNYNYGFNGELVLDNHGTNDFQVSSDLGTFGFPTGQGQIWASVS